VVDLAHCVQVVDGIANPLQRCVLLEPDEGSQREHVPEGVEDLWGWPALVKAVAFVAGTVGTSRVVGEGDRVISPAGG
jgi:hypothetical protein